MIMIDIEMPEKCGDCPCFHAEYPMHCQLIKPPDKNKQLAAPYGLPRPDWCPLMADALALLKEQMEKEQCLKTKCTICPHCDNCDVDENGRIKDSTDIVRCKDCKNWIPGYITGQDEFIAPKCGKYRQMVGHSSDDFCSLAERQ